MASRPIWRGHLRLALYNARHDRAAIRFHIINPETGNRIRIWPSPRGVDRQDPLHGHIPKKAVTAVNASHSQRILTVPIGTSIKEVIAEMVGKPFGNAP